MENNGKETPLEKVNEALFEMIVQEEMLENLFMGDSHYKHLPELKRMNPDEIFKKYPHSRQVPVTGDGSYQEYQAYTPEGVLLFTIMEKRCVENTLVPYMNERTKKLYEKLFSNR